MEDKLVWEKSTSAFFQRIRQKHRMKKDPNQCTGGQSFFGEKTHIRWYLYDIGYGTQYDHFVKKTK